jgi:hypothetical protein
VSTKGRFKKKGGGGNASGGSGVRCAAAGCKGGWVEWKRTKTTPIKEPMGAGGKQFEEKTEVTNEKCGVCDGTGWV